VLDVLARKITKTRFAIRKAVGHGCGRLHKRALQWARELHRQQCSRLMLVCDLDENSLSDLSARLTKALEGCLIERRVVVIPVREIEAWLLADHEAINQAFKLRPALKQQANPQGIAHLKEHPGSLIDQRTARHIRYTNSIHNVRIAEHARVDRLLSRCTSFKGFEAFVREQLG
jgi:Domain of unknown function (DUF4276)